MSSWVAVLVYGLIGILAGLYVLQVLYKWTRFVRTINKIPGPPCYPVIGNGLEMFSPPESILDAFYGRYKKYGPIYRIWNGPLATIVIANAEYFEIIMASTVNLDRSLLYKMLSPWLGQGLITIRGSKWKPRRKILMPAFHFKMLEGFLDVMVAKSQNLIDVLRKQNNGQYIELLSYVSMCALDVIREAAMGVQSNILLSESDSEFLQGINKLSTYTVSREMKPWLQPDFIYNLTSEGKDYNKNLKLVHGETDKVIEQRKKIWQNSNLNSVAGEEKKLGIKKPSVFLDIMLDAIKDGEILSAQDIRDEVTTFLFAGHDTTSASATWVLLYLAVFQDVQEKVAEEMESIFHGSDRPPTMNDINEMKYLERVIKEILRLYPSSPFIGRRLSYDVQFGDYLLPAGTELTIDLYSAHRDPEYFPDPEKFNPDNFLPGVTAKRHPYAYVPFSAGPRNCIGQKFALLEEKTVVSTVIRNFKLETYIKPNEIEAYRTIIISPKSNAPVKLINRH